MSTKTTLKRIALVAVSALGFSVFSVAPSFATGDALGTLSVPTKATVTKWLDAADATDSIFGKQCLEAVVTGAATCTGSAGGYVTVGFQPAAADSDTVFTVTTSGASIVGAAVSATSGASEDVAYKNGLNFTDGVTVRTNTNTSDTAVGQADIQITRATAGTSTITFSEVNATTGVSSAYSTATITWVDATSLAISLSNSSVIVKEGAAAAFTDVDAVADDFATNLYTLNSSRSVTTQAATVYVTLKDSLGNAVNSKALSAEITGNGLVSGLSTDGATTGDLTTTTCMSTANSKTKLCSLSASSLYDGAGGMYGRNKAVFTIWGDGTSGSGTVTIKQGTTVLRTFTVSFYRAGVPATLDAVANYTALKYGGSVTDAVTVTAKDAAGSPVEGLSLVQSAASAAADLTDSPATGWTCSARGADIYPGVYFCYPTLAGTKAGAEVYGTVKASFADSAYAAYAYATSSSVSITVGKATIASLAMTLDKSSYSPGEKATVTLTAKDSNGNPVGDDGTYTSIFTLASNLSTSSTLPTGFDTSTRTVKGIVNGVQTFTVYAPTISGEWTLTLSNSATSTTLASALRGTKLTATATVNAGAAEKAADAATDAANEAIDAANAATDAANLAAEAADAATVAAEEARDAADAATAAVEELATQVATLMAALKAQITTLANTVAKIAKKVKA